MHNSWPHNHKEGRRTAIGIIDADHITITAYNVTPEGQADKAVETVYTRV